MRKIEYDLDEQIKKISDLLYLAVLEKIEGCPKRIEENPLLNTQPKLRECYNICAPCYAKPKILEGK